MRVPLPQIRSNGHAPQPGRVYMISGMCQNPRFRLSFGTAHAEDFCLISMGIPGTIPGGAAAGIAGGAVEVAGADGDPYFVLRRCFDEGAAVVAARVDWEGIFTLLANDDEYAETVFTELVAPGVPEDTVRQWSEDASTVMMFSEILHLA
ncbi:MAG TPA: hypothetical protein VNE83_05620 [Terriglobales bacterium]|nr:hypothetical protein [Terriglobales bacterium]